MKALIEQSGSEVTDGSKLVAEAADKVTGMLDGIRENTSLIEAIAQATQEQSSAIAQMTVAIRQMDEMTQHNAALVEETTAAIEQTEGQAVELDRIVDVFVTDAAARIRPVERAAPAAKEKPVAVMQSRAKAAAKTYRIDGNAAVERDWSEF